MSKLQDIRNLVQEHAVSVSSSPGDWMDYMDTAPLRGAANFDPTDPAV